MTMESIVLYTERRAGRNTKTHQNINMIASECLKWILLFLFFTLLYNVSNTPHDGGGRDPQHMYFLNS